MNYATTLPAVMPLLGNAALDCPALVTREHLWTWREVHRAAAELAAKLEPGATICNMCGSRAGFLITWLAALRSSNLQLLPPSGGSADLISLLRSSARPLIIVDAARLVDVRWQEHAPCLVHEPRVTTPLLADESVKWTPNWDRVSVQLYTSGSTGAPEAQTRTLRQLTHGALALGAALEGFVGGGLAAVRGMVCSVAPQHMFGLETSVMLSLVSGIPVHEGRPLLASDVQAALSSSACGTAWIATPLHLRACAQAEDVLPNCNLVISSTMPLARDLAAEIERIAAAPVVEIYGSTETGAIATRRVARSPRWQPLPGVSLQSTVHAPQHHVEGQQFTSPQPLQDQILVCNDGGFELLGRTGDMIKIAGRRASLAGLNLLLQDLPGLGDGVFYLPRTGDATQRLILIHDGPPLERGATDAWLRARLDPTFLPRNIIRVTRLPRSDNGKLTEASLARIFAEWSEGTERS